MKNQGASVRSRPGLMCGCAVNGTHASIRSGVNTPRKPSPATPISAYGRPFTTTVLPTTSGLAPKFDTQNRCEITTEAPSAVAASGVSGKKRPSCGVNPSTEKYPGLTMLPATAMLAPSCVTVSAARLHTATPSRDWFRVWMYLKKLFDADTPSDQSGDRRSIPTSAVPSAVPGNGRSTIAFIALKMVVTAPTPSESAPTATRVKRGLGVRLRRANRRTANRLSIIG